LIVASLSLSKDLKFAQISSFQMVVQTSVQTMTSIVTTKQKSLKLEESPVPSLENHPTSVLIKVEASGINFADIMAKKGFYPDAPPLPTVVGYEVSGIVQDVGSQVSKSWIGKSGRLNNSFS
jgi:NADPH:quinone reductase-like Zn-dependent oxidoreductase